ncbi:hypothetical protein MTP04_16400 [Lysinibacillus sp. PLM2]|nr:hypothetical protein MTP04_16400 [Lysinibacillus sp. PLM2]
MDNLLKEVGNYGIYYNGWKRPTILILKARGEFCITNFKKSI